MQRELEIQSPKFNIYFTDEEALVDSFEELATLLEQSLLIFENEESLKLPVGIDSYNINLNILPGMEIKKINLEHRKKDKDTDVLSFPLQDDIRNGIFEAFNKELELGDILISHEKCKEQASDFDISYGDEFIHLFIHGLLHLFGYDHELNSSEDIIMRELENKILEGLKKHRS